MSSIFSLVLCYFRFSFQILFFFFFQISECLTTAYKNGTFSQIPYLVEFLLHVSKSIHATASDIRSRHLSACFAMEKIEHVVDTLFGDDDVIGKSCFIILEFFV